MGRILVIDDSETILKVLTMVLQSHQHEVVASEGGDAGKQSLLGREYDLMLTDIRMQPYDGLQFLKLAQEKWPMMPVVMMTGFATIDTVKEAVALGAFDYINKPLKVDHLLDAVDRALQYGKGLKVKSAGLYHAEVRHYIPGIVAESAPMKQACELIKRVAPTTTTVLICGESGVGKRLVARTIHSLSRRGDQPFVCIDCSTVDPEDPVAALLGDGVTSEIGRADRGTVLFERVESAGPQLQDLMLDLVRNKGIAAQQPESSSRGVDVRILASTDANLADLVDAGVFIEELHDRLRLLPIAVAPLRERREDVLPIVQSILKREAGDGKVPVLDSGLVDALLSYSWPGNTAELEMVVKDLLLRCADGRINKEMLPASVLSAAEGNQLMSVKPDDSRYKTLKAFLQTSGPLSTTRIPAKPEPAESGVAPIEPAVAGEAAQAPDAAEAPSAAPPVPDREEPPSAPAESSAPSVRAPGSPAAEAPPRVEAVAPTPEREPPPAREEAAEVADLIAPAVAGETAQGPEAARAASAAPSAPDAEEPPSAPAESSAPSVRAPASPAAEAPPRVEAVAPTPEREPPPAQEEAAEEQAETAKEKQEEISVPEAAEDAERKKKTKAARKRAPARKPVDAAAQAGKQGDREAAGKTPAPTAAKSARKGNPWIDLILADVDKPAENGKQTE